MGLVPTLFDFVEGTPAYPDQVDSNFANIRNVVNGQIDAVNLASGAVTPAKVGTIPRAKCAVTPHNQLAQQGGGPMPLGAAEFDTDNMYDDVNDYFTVVTAGVYVVSAYVLHTALVAAAMTLERRPGGGAPVVFAGNGNNTNNQGAYMSLSGVDYFSAGDRIDATWYNGNLAQAGVASGILVAAWQGP